jgi:serine/threonine protein kinase
VSADAPEGLCPRCLLQAGLESTAAGSLGSPPPTEPLPACPLPVGRGEGKGEGQPRAANDEPLARLRYFGDYELLSKIAEGGMGVVYRARQVSLNRTVAVKMIRAGRFASSDDVKRFHTEAEAAANLQHPNIVAIHEVGEHEGQHYFSMDYVEGKNLAELVRDGPLPPAKAAALVKTMAEAIHYAHQRGTLHRDLKPSNVLLDATGQPRITDFGLAKRFVAADVRRLSTNTERGKGNAEQSPSLVTSAPTDLTQTGAVMGTPAYMPPEQAAGRRAEFGPASDVYALGAMLYELLAGKPPFLGETPMATLMKVLEEEPVSPKKHNPSVPPDLETICLKCLEKQPARRYPMARELAEELGRFLNQESIIAKPASGARKLWSWGKRNPWAITGAISLVTLALFWWGYAMWLRSEYLLGEKLHPRQAKDIVFMDLSRVFSPWGILLALVVVVSPFQVRFRRSVRRRVIEGIPVPARSSLTFAAASLIFAVLAIGLGCDFISAYIGKIPMSKRGSPMFGNLMFFLGFVAAYVWRRVSNLREALREHYFLLFLAPEESEVGKEKAIKEERREQEERRKPDTCHGALSLVALLASGVGTVAIALVMEVRYGWAGGSTLGALTGYLIGMVVIKLWRRKLYLTFYLLAVAFIPALGLAFFISEQGLKSTIFSLLPATLAAVLGAIPGAAFGRIAAGEELAQQEDDKRPWYQRLAGYFGLDKLR